ncbi:MAG: hypothetical protein ABJF10_02105 [Chthoniobacter sp.]|uniref:hypothetical protein n=1 Tax=Chthoniobacter sp. TaxID=2510640 RepID=UPI0032AAB93B
MAAPSVACGKIKHIRPAGEETIRGNRAAVWGLAQLPDALRGELVTLAAARGFRDAGAMLTTPQAQWQPPVPLAAVAGEALGKARKLCTAFAGTLQRLNDLTLSEAEFSQRGMADYRAAFGYEISAKQWKRLLDRTVSRDRGAEDWQRLEIYLDENCARKSPASTVAAVLSGNDHRELRDLIASFKKPADPAKGERVLLWQRVFDRYADLLADGMPARTARRGLVAFLALHAPSLARTAHALHVAFNAKLAKWEAGEGKPSALADGRASANRERTLELSKEDRETLLALAAKLGGGLSQGWREAIRRGVLSADLVQRYIGNARSKSYVPHAVREALGNDVKLLDDLMHGPRQARLGGAYISRDPNTFAAGDWMQGDDCTLPVYYSEETAEGVRLMRGQFLAMIDVRTTYILGFVLISAPPDRPSTYNAWHIRNLITTVHEMYGLPRHGFYFENGSWRAKVLTGNFADQTGTETGLREFGLKFRHARLPRAKVVERVFGALQNTMEAEPGYIGRGWHNDRYERTERAKRFVESGKLKAGDHFYTRDQCIERLTHLVQLYNEEPQGGKYCGGLSPKDAYEKHFGEVPLLRLPNAARYLLANERKLLKVGRNGISFRAGSEVFTYKSAETGALIGRPAEVFFNRESPEVLGVKHPDSGEVFAVRRAAQVPAMDADDETLAQAFAENEAHDGYKRALYRAIRPKFSQHFLGRPIFRPTMIDAATVEAGRQFAESAEAEKKAVTTQQRLHRRTSAAAQKIGMRVRAGRDPETQASAAEKLAALMAKAEQEKD